MAQMIIGFGMSRALSITSCVQLWNMPRSLITTFQIVSAEYTQQPQKEIDHSCTVHAPMQLDFKLQHFPVRQLPGPDRSGNFPDRIQLKHCSYCEYYYYEWKLGVDTKSGFIFYFIQKLLEVKLLEVLFWGVPAAHFNIHQNHKYIVQEEGVMLT